MFRKLRNKFIFFNAGITAILIIIVFSIIYATASQSAIKRPPIKRTAPSYTEDIKTIIGKSIDEEREDASKALLSILIFSGFAIEICVVVISYFLANLAIKPVKEAYESQKIFIANASHEIKTPLAAISANLEAADIHGNPWISNIEYETKKITNLNNSLLKLAKSDTNTTNTKTKQTNLKKLIKKELNSFIPRLKSNNKKIVFRQILNSNYTKEINQEDFCEILNILLDNALKYCNATIELSLQDSEVVVKNDGKLIPKDHLPHIFDRFYQIDKSTEGSGLGLSIAASIAERNRWEINAKTDAKFNIFTLSI